MIDGSRQIDLLGGRDQELARVVSLLEEKRPALVLVEGEVGMGKSTFLRAIELEARTAGFTVVRGLSIGRETNELIFANEVSEMLGASPYGARPSVDLATPKSAGAELRRSVTPVTEGLRTPLVDTVDVLRSNAPALVLIDDFRPDPAFLDRFVHSFLRALKKPDGPVVTVIAGRHTDVAPLTGAADLVVALQRLDEGHLRSDFEALGRELGPPLAPDELEIYVREAVRSPEIAAALLHVLPLARAKTEAP